MFLSVVEVHALCMMKGLRGLAKIVEMGHVLGFNCLQAAACIPLTFTIDTVNCWAWLGMMQSQRRTWQACLP